MMTNAVRQATALAWPFLQRIRAIVAPLFGSIPAVHAKAMTIPGWISGDDARMMARKSLMLADEPVIVEVGIFMGRSTALLAGARRIRGNGRIYSIDPFDCSGDGFSVPIYQEKLKASKQRSLEDVFVRNMDRLGLMPWIEVRRGTSESVARVWTLPIDLLLLDANQTADGAKAIFDEWIPFLRPGGTLMLSNSADKAHPVGHDGNRRLVESALIPPQFTNVRTIHDFTFAEKVG